MQTDVQTDSRTGWLAQCAAPIGGEEGESCSADWVVKVEGADSLLTDIHSLSLSVQCLVLGSEISSGMAVSSWKPFRRA